MGNPEARKQTCEAGPVQHEGAAKPAAGAIAPAAAKLERAVSRIRESRNELLAILERLVGFPTVSPPARNTAAAQAYLAEQLEAAGFGINRWELYPGDPVVVGVKPGTQPASCRSLILNGHMDVAEVGQPAEWQGDPFALRVEGDWACGRGTADMKGALAAALLAIRVMGEEGIELGGNLQFQSAVGEEAGEAGTRSITERGLADGYDYAVVMDTSNLAIQGQGGVITGWLTVQSPQVHHDGMRASMLHAGGGVFGASAIEKMAKLIGSLQELERHWAVVKHYPGFPPGSTTINPAVIEGGRHAAFVADTCRLWITVHFYPDEDYQSVTEEIEEHIRHAAMADPWLREHPPAFTWGGRSMIEDRGEIFPSLELDREHPGLPCLAACHAEAAGKQPEVGMSPSVTDAGWLAAAGVPAAIYGPGLLSEAHGINEGVSVTELLTFAESLLRFTAVWCNSPKPEGRDMA
ncbi:MAG: acetylornithine deacetylase or succinyl-diaminopimelate desuccinylase [Paenibacillaceae bacterium]|nr:acetylornithine deacetylase or succinyl-diaminopimelate desuccinylase [Paenibacillaceae bacterium]